LLNRSGESEGDIGVQVQALTPSLSEAIGASTGVAVTWVDPKGALAGTVSIGDVIETFNGEDIPTLEHWNVRAARLVTGDTLVLRVRSQRTLRVLRVVAPARRSPFSRDSLGLALRRIPSVGAEVFRVDIDSVAAESGLAIGDVITLIGNVASPTPDQIRRVYAATASGQPVLVGVTRGAIHYVTTFRK
jgi:serine protease Do